MSNGNSEDEDKFSAMFDGADPETVTAAVKIQGLFRQRNARRSTALLVTATFEKVRDDSSGLFYYYNSKSGESTWEKPKFLGESAVILSPRSREKMLALAEKRKTGRYKNAESLDEEAAASMIQGLFRTRVARRQIMQLVSAAYEKILDPSTGKHFYFNKKTGETSWEKPALLGDKELSRDGKVIEKDEVEIDQPSNSAATTTAVAAAVAEPSIATDSASAAADGAAVVTDIVNAKAAASEMMVANEAAERSPRNSIWSFLQESKLEVLRETLEEEGFDDMEALTGITRKDAFEMGIKTKLIQQLLDSITEYRVARGLGTDQDPDDSDDDNEAGLDDTDLLGSDKEDENQVLDRLVESVSVMEFVENEGGEGRPMSAEDERDTFDSDASEDGEGGYEYDEDEDDNSVDLTQEIPGVRFEELFPGDNENFPVIGEFARVHYTASLEDGTVFESSRKRGRAFEFLVGAGHVIPGWDKSVRRMSRGQRAKLTIEPELAYGEIGRPPIVRPNARLIFEIELIDMYEAKVGLLDDLEVGEVALY